MENAKFEYMYVMDYSTSSISEVRINNNKEIEDVETFLDELGFNHNTCHWMFTQTKINNITEIEKVN